MNINNLPDKDSLFETVVVSANDELVKMFLEKKIKFVDISKTLLKIIKLKEFVKLKKIIPKNVQQVNKLANYVSLKINIMSI